MQKHLEIIKAKTTGETSFRHHPESQHLGSLMGRGTYKNWTRDIATRRGPTQQFVACDSSSTSHSLWSLTVPHICSDAFLFCINFATVPTLGR